MSLIKTIEYTIAATDDDSIATAQTTSGAANLVLNGAGVSGGIWKLSDKTTRRVTMFSSGNISTVVFTITGKLLPGGVDVTDTITGINNSTGTSTQYFYSVSNIAASAIVGTNVIAGFGQAAATLPLLPQNYTFDRASVSVEIVSGSTATVTLQQTFTDILGLGQTSSYNESLAGWMNNDATVPLVNLTSGQTSCFYQSPVVGLRLLLSSYSSSPVLRLRTAESVE